MRITGRGEDVVAPASTLSPEANEDEGALRGRGLREQEAQQRERPAAAVGDFIEFLFLIAYGILARSSSLLPRLQRCTIMGTFSLAHVQ